MSMLLRWSVFALLVSALWCGANAALEYTLALETSPQAVAAWQDDDSAHELLLSGRWWLVARTVSRDDTEHGLMLAHLEVFERSAASALACILLVPALCWFTRQAHAEEQHGR